MENMQPKENLQETPIKKPIDFTLECKTPPTQEVEQNEPKSHSSCNDFRKSGIPDPLKVPKAFKYPERYRSPTDLMMSPVTKGLLARNRKGGILLPPSINQPKAQDVKVQDAIAFKIEI